MNSYGDGKPEPADSENAIRLLELELARQRATRLQAGAPYRGLRLASFIFLAAVILGAALAFYYVFFSGSLDELRSRSSSQPSPSATPRSHAP